MHQCCLKVSSNILPELHVVKGTKEVKPHLRVALAQIHALAVQINVVHEATADPP